MLCVRYVGGIPTRFFRDSHFDASISLDPESPCFWLLKVEREGALLEDLTGFRSFEDAYGFLLHRHPLMEEVTRG